VSKSTNRIRVVSDADPAEVEGIVMDFINENPDNPGNQNIQFNLLNTVEKLLSSVANLLVLAMVLLHLSDIVFVGLIVLFQTISIICSQRKPHYDTVIPRIIFFATTIVLLAGMPIALTYLLALPIYKNGIISLSGLIAISLMIFAIVKSWGAYGLKALLHQFHFILIFTLVIVLPYIQVTQEGKYGILAAAGLSFFIRDFIIGRLK
jgi:hypothetical protein